MLAFPERLIEADSPGRDEGSKTLRKVVVIQVKSKGYTPPGRFYNRGETKNIEENDAEKGVDRVLGSKVVDLTEGRVVFWFIKRSISKCLGFESSFLQGAAAAIVVLELSDHQTIQATSELLRDICKVFTIPVMLVVGGKINDDLIGLESESGFEEIASRVITFSNAGKKTLQAA
jgi:hypothetical protein